MSYAASGFGKVYEIPTTNDSSVIPNMTLRMDVPLDLIVNDAIELAWPNVMGRVAEAVPLWAPLLVDAAWPRAMQRVPEAVEVATPHASKQIDAILAKGKESAAIVGGVLAGGVLIAGLAAAVKFGWLQKLRA